MDLPALPHVSFTFSSTPTPSTAYSRELATSPHFSQPMATETSTSGSVIVPGATNQRSDNHAYGFGPNAPSRYLLFPACANITTVELLTFLPNSIHCADFVYRFFTNGGSQPLLCTIVNQQRSLLVEWGKRGGRQAIYDTMRRAGYTDWGTRSHSISHEKQDQTWEEANLDVGGYKTPGQLYKRPVIVDNVPFRDLAKDVKQIPQGDDALDLTRMVQHCVQNPHEAWLYPRDWNALLGHLGGPGAVRHGHTDREAFKRRAIVASSQGRNVQLDMLLEAHSRVDDFEKTEMSGFGNTPRQKRKLKAVTPSSTALLTSGPQIPETQKKEKRRGRQKKATAINKDATGGFVVQEEEEDLAQQYIRSDEYVSPPDDTIMPLAVHPESEGLCVAFLQEGQVGEDDPYNAYAFGGPRHRPPYRWLYLIHKPDPADNSGWAENLRWASVQNILYSHPCHPDTWNESPEHMERIVRIRRELCWMSDEYQEQLEQGEGDLRTH